MYYVEEIINGVLCYKTTPNEDWIPFTREMLTIKLKGAEERIAALKSFINETRPAESDDLKGVLNGIPEEK